jgi:glycosyltransferase involved in cell wall biosynthesis
VLHLLGPSTGGIRAHVATLADALEARGWDVGVAGPAGVLDGLRKLDHEVPVPAGLSPAGVVRARRALRGAAAGADLVHAHGLKAGWVATLLRPRPPVVLSVHNLVLDDVAGRAAPVLRVLEGGLVGRVDHVVAISDEVARRFTGSTGAGRTTTVPPLGPAPVPTRSREEVRAGLGVPHGARLVVTAARLHPQKGMVDLLDAAALLRSAAPEAVRWVVLGEGPQRAALEAEVAARGLGDVVDLAGARASVADELAAADVVAVTSRWESGPLVVLEALALGRPVVATSVGLVPAVVGPEQGRVVPVGDPAALAAAVAEVLAAGDEAFPGVPRAGRYGPESLVPPIEAVYQELLSPR